MAGKLIVIEGVDCSGTQATLLSEKLKCKKVSFPNYDSYSSDAVKAYLRGDFGTDVNSVSPYTASVFFATDRFISFKTGEPWKEYLNGDTLVADRYIMSNAIHQAAKLKTEEEKETFIKWIFDLEYEHNGMPKEDINIFLDMPLWAIKLLNEKRENKFDSKAGKDIHERDESYLAAAYENAMFVATHCNADVSTIIHCAENGRIKTAEEIHEEIIQVLRKNKII